MVRDLRTNNREKKTNVLKYKMITIKLIDFNTQLSYILDSSTIFELVLNNLNQYIQKPF